MAFTVPPAVFRDPNPFSDHAEHQVKIWIVDVDGAIAWYTAAYPPGTTPIAIQEVEQVIASIRFDELDGEGQ